MHALGIANLNIGDAKRGQARDTGAGDSWWLQIEHGL
jgi:hypothetical protein